MDARDQTIDTTKYVFGAEYTYAWLHYLRTSTFGSPRNVVFTGDSVTANAMITDALYYRETMFRQMAARDGMGDMFACVNHGHPGDTTKDWFDTHIADDLSSNPIMLVTQWGANDPAGKAGPPAVSPLSDKQSKYYLRGCLERARTVSMGGKPVQDMTIVLMMPNSMSDTPYGRDAERVAEISGFYMEAARDYDCCFIDTYGYARDVRWASGSAFDNYFGNYVSIHPLEDMQFLYMTLLYEAVMPRALLTTVSRNWNVNISGNTLKVAAGTPLTSYQYGDSKYRCNSDVSWAYKDGWVETKRTADGFGAQFNYGLAGSNGCARRNWNHVSSSWLSWVTL